MAKHTTPAKGKISNNRGGKLKLRYLDGLKVLGKASFDVKSGTLSEMAKQVPVFKEDEFQEILTKAGSDKTAKAKAIYEYIYKDINAYKFSDADKKARNNPDERIYGELVFDTVQELLVDVNQLFFTKIDRSRANFYELGSGAGRAIILASLLGNFNHYYGYEYYPNLFELSTVMHRKYLQCLQTANMMERNCPIDFIRQDLLDVDIDNDVQHHFIWMNYPHNNVEFYRQLPPKFRAIRGHVMLASVIQEMPMSGFTRVHSKQYPFDWGKSEVFFYERNAE